MPELTIQGSMKNFEGYDSDKEVRDEAIRTFLDLVKTSFDPQHVHNWVRASVIRQNLFSDMVVGHIRWPRSLGRPDTPSLSDGFLIRTEFWVDAWRVDPDGTVIEDLQAWLPSDPPVMREFLSDLDHYSVGYVCHSSALGDKVEVDFADVPWHHPGRYGHARQLYLSSHGYEFYSDGKFVALPDITVDSQPFFHL